MVSKSYMLEKPSRPSSAKVFLDQQIIPAAIDVAGAFEVGLQRASRRTGMRPSVLLGAAAGAALLLAALALSRRVSFVDDDDLSLEARARLGL